MHPYLKPSRSAILPAFLILVLFVCSCHVSYVSFRPEQKIIHSDTAIVTRVYMDRYGDLYPDTAVYIDSRKFRVDGGRGSKTLASLAHYFLSGRKRIKRLGEFYGVSTDSPAIAYREVQSRIRDNYIREIDRHIRLHNAGRVIYLVHGFNDTIAETEYTQLRDSLSRQHFPADEKPVFVDVHWDGLNAHAFDGVAVAKVWKPALLDSRFASISLRKLMTGLEQKNKIPAIIITHSLGGGVALGALFNTTHKWDMLDLITPRADKRLLQKLILAPTPVSPVRVGMFAPAIPGENTFIDFNSREPAAIDPAQNNIGKVVIGYNYSDYGVSKQLMGIKLAPIYGSTSLGCNLTLFGRSAIDNVYSDMDKLHYGPHTHIIVPLEFHTPPRVNPPVLEQGTTEHAFYYYIANPKLNDFLGELF